MPCIDPENPAGNVFTLVKLQQEGSLRRGDVIATDRLGQCDVTSIFASGSVEVRTRSSGRRILIAGIDFPIGTQFHTRDPRESLMVA